MLYYESIDKDAVFAKMQMYILSLIYFNLFLIDLCYYAYVALGKKYLPWSC